MRRDRRTLRMFAHVCARTRCSRTGTRNGGLSWAGMRKLPPIAVCLALLLLTPPESAQAEWVTYEGENGTSIPYPRDLFSVRDTRPGMRGVRFISPDGRAELNIFTLQNDRNE